MARTEHGAQLTAQHKQAQHSLRSTALRGFLRLWPLWEGDDGSFQRLVMASLPLVEVHHRISANLGVAYYQAFRVAEGVGGSPAPRLIDTVDRDAVAASLYITGRNMTRKAIAAGYSADAARQVALVRTSGAVARHVLAGGRDSLVASSAADRHAHGYSRIVSAGACSFCRSLADRGTTTDDFRAHDHCGCSAEPDFS